MSPRYDESPFEEQLNQQFEQAQKLLKEYLPKIVPIAAGLIGVLWLAPGTYSVNPGQVGVVRTFNRSHPARAKLPFPLAVSAVRRGERGANPPH